MQTAKMFRFSMLLAIVITIAATAISQAQTTATVTLNLTKYSKVEHAAAGDYVGVSPGVIRLHVGDHLVFVNTDSRHHTATSIADASSFPEEPRWSTDQLKPNGNIGASAWSTGDLGPGARSTPLTATKPGTYLYGCFFDYSAGMRGVIVVEP
jgi:plastocyanin